MAGPTADGVVDDGEVDADVTAQINGAVAVGVFLRGPRDEGDVKPVDVLPAAAAPSLTAVYWECPAWPVPVDQATEQPAALDYINTVVKNKQKCSAAKLKHNSWKLHQIMAKTRKNFNEEASRVLADSAVICRQPESWH